MTADGPASAPGERPAMSRRLRREDVTKPDGRYLIYYSWPDRRPANGDPGGEPRRRRDRADV